MELHIFDFDYTLYRTVESVIIWSSRGSRTVNDRLCFSISPEEFHSYELGKDEEVDEESFQEFHEINWLGAKPIVPVLNIFESCQNKLILTARNQKVEPFIRRKFDESIPFMGLGDGSVQAKIDKINQIKSVNQDICIYEDSNDLISHFAGQGEKCVHVKSTHFSTVLEFLNF